MSTAAQIRHRGAPNQGPPRHVLVIAGSYRQFEIWRRTQPLHRGRRARYCASEHDTRGVGPEHVEAVVLTGEWWLSDVYRDERSWRPLVALAEAVQDGRMSWLSWAEQTLEERALMAMHEEPSVIRQEGSVGGKIESSTRFRVEGEIKEARARTSAIREMVLRRSDTGPGRSAVRS